MKYREIKNVAVYISEDNMKIVITGIPEEEGDHNCDDMGCSSSECVIIRATIDKLGL